MEKVILITGASSGIGYATVRQLLSEGFIVYGAARRVEKMSDLKDKGMHLLAMDLTVDSTMVGGVNQIIKEKGRIDILINNAGYGSYGAIEDVPLDEAKRQFEVNVFGLARLSQLVLPYMRSNNFGKIINISSMGGKIYTPMAGWYHATKFAVEGLSDCLRLETKQFGIDVIVIEPGEIQSEWSGLAIDSLLKISGNTVYANLAKKLAKLMKTSYANPKISDPQVIAYTILKAIKSKKPKTRYVAGHLAKKCLFSRKILSDKMFDRMMTSALE